MNRSWCQWHPITELDNALLARRAPSLEGLAQVWTEERESMQDLQVELAFLERWKNRLAVETGVLEGLYSLDRGVTGGDDGSDRRPVQVVSQEPFTATSREDSPNVRERFASWLRTDLARALASWQRGL